MSSSSFDSGTSLTNDASSCCAFLCDLDGQVIHDFGEQRPGSNESLSARSVIDLIEPGSLVDFLEIVRTRGLVLGWQTKIHFGGSARNLLLHGFQTPCGVLIFAPWTPDAASLQDGGYADSTPATDSRRREDGNDIANLIEIAHDLQNPISSIVSACEFLATYDHENLNPEQLEMIVGIQSGVTSLLQLSARISALGAMSNRTAAPENVNAEPSRERIVHGGLSTGEKAS